MPSPERAVAYEDNNRLQLTISRREVRVGQRPQAVLQTESFNHIQNSGPRGLLHLDTLGLPFLSSSGLDLTRVHDAVHSL